LEYTTSNSWGDNDRPQSNDTCGLSDHLYHESRRLDLIPTWFDLVKLGYLDQF
jgi:hypothetical protein